jgi:single-strand DNA-binding protein
MRAPNLNSVTLVGQLTGDPALRTTSQGLAVCELSLAVADLPDKPALFIDVATFGDAAEDCQRHLSKGDQVAVAGRLTYRQWETKSGGKRAKHQVVGKVFYATGEEIAGASNGNGLDGDESAFDPDDV